MIECTIRGHALALETAPELFSPSRVDAGTLAMLERADFAPGGKVLDLGCGCGVVGIVAAKELGEDSVVLCDIDPLAAAVAGRNAARNGVPGVRIRVGDGLSAVEETGFTLILCNPPYHADFSVAKRFIEKGFNRLVVGGRMMLVVKRRDWYRNKLAAVFGGVRIEEEDGYLIMTAEKRGARYAGKDR